MRSPGRAGHGINEVNPDLERSCVEALGGGCDVWDEGLLLQALVFNFA